MILVDTSVLIDFFKGKKSLPRNKFKQLLEIGLPFGITAFIYQELLQGAASDREYEKMKRFLSTQRFYHPLDPVDSFAEAARIYFDCRRKGITVRSTIDCLIAQIALEHHLLVLHNDKYFEAIQVVFPELRFY